MYTYFVKVVQCPLQRKPDKLPIFEKLPGRLARGLGTQTYGNLAQIKIKTRNASVNKPETLLKSQWRFGLTDSCCVPV